MSKELLNRARELHRRKMLAGAKSSMDQSIAEMTLLDMFDYELTIDDIRTSNIGTYFAAADTLGQHVRVIMGDGFQWEITENELGSDIFVLASLDDNKKVLWHGWIPFHEVESSEPFGDGDVKFYKLDSEHSLPLPSSEFKFMIPCSDVPCDSNALWDQDCDSWQCFGCDRLRYDFSGKQEWPGAPSGDHVPTQETRG